MRILELGGNWSGPLVGLFLGSLGAEVIRLESTAHLDTMRTLPAPRIEGRKVEGATKEDNLYFAQLNAGKRSVLADLSSAEGRALALDLVDSADVVVENLAPGALDRLGLGYAVLSARNPGLCVLSLPALHPDDPLPNLRGYAPVFSAMGGLEVLTTPAGEARAVGMLETGWGDPNGGAVGLLGLLAALVRRARTGLGAHIICSQVKAVTWQLDRPFSRYAGAGSDGVHPETPSGEWGMVLPTEGDRWVVAAGDRCQAEAVAVGAGLSSPDLLAQWSGERPPDEVERILQAAGLVTAPVVSAEQAARAPRAAARGVVEEIDHPVLGHLPRFHVPWLLDGVAPRCHEPAPVLGEGTELLSGGRHEAAAAERRLKRD